MLIVFCEESNGESFKVSKSLRVRLWFIHKVSYRVIMCESGLNLEPVDRHIGTFITSILEGPS